MELKIFGKLQEKLAEKKETIYEIASLRRLDSHFFVDWSLIAGFSFLLDFHCILASQKKKADGRLRGELRVSAHGED